MVPDPVSQRSKMSGKFDQFVKQQLEASASVGVPLDLAKEKAHWLKKLSQLYALVEDSLSEHIESGAIALRFVETKLTEDWLGTYIAPGLHVAIGMQLVKLKPVGTVMLGSRGRVDMMGPRGVCRLILVPADAITPRVRAMTPLDEDFSRSDDWVWKIATPPPHITYIELTAENFRETLMGVVNG